MEPVEEIRSWTHCPLLITVQNDKKSSRGTFFKYTQHVHDTLTKLKWCYSGVSYYITRLNLWMWDQFRGCTVSETFNWENNPFRTTSLLGKIQSINNHRMTCEENMFRTICPWWKEYNFEKSLDGIYCCRLFLSWLHFWIHVPSIISVDSLENENDYRYRWEAVWKPNEVVLDVDPAFGCFLLQR